MQYQNESEQLNRKQQLLRREIYDKGYDCQAFQDYMEQLKVNGGQDVNIWTYQELQEAISLFQTTNQPQMETIELDDVSYRQSEFDDHAQFEVPQNLDEQLPQVKQEQQLQNQKQQNQIVSNGMHEEIVAKPSVDNERFYQKVHLCKLQDKKMILTANEINVQITKFEKIQGGLLSASYYIYIINTEPIGWNVQRRYNDFVWLREVLNKMYPGRYIPPLPKKTVLKNDQELYLIKRMKFLEKFLQGLFQIELIRHDKWFYAFLSIKEEKDFKQIQKLSTQLSRVTKLEQIISLDGQVQLQINDNLVTYNQESSSLINSIDLSYKKLRKESKQLLLDFDQLSNTIYNMGQTCTDLYQFSNKFNQSISQGKISKLDILYISMNNMLVQWGNNLTAQIKIVQEELCSFFKFHHHSITSLKEFIKQKEQAQQEYEKFKSKLELKKHKLFASQDFNRWEVPSIQIKALQDSNLTQNREVCLAIMLPQETTLQEELKNIFAFYNYQQFSEINSHLENTVTAFSEHFIKFCSLQKEMLAEQKLVWDKSIVNFNNLHYPQQIILKKT
ncbi:unnamed protein product (macronuclear) [Paramecium tetraurelia]|uniref:PX domain-containing protein n=1 Tax=Paramecium tetraurelia TaxID=5888 RepID=A0CWT1_PARTE|nr:uncharacterized protein GSPATT00001451001 [Paramecium tetraurelia]CAK75248.1 unnamed protein product [Paramecium tetraurelia]|eukprot:XP_001442645.1 hypothetical protein (macronuclear) [Paramecium tetraurelia strain d4-2]